MRAIMITFDSLNKRILPCYGNREIQAPGFERLQERCTRFDQCYAGSLPCIPARREMHTGRENFLHCRWAALEPFDDSVPELLKKHGIYTHLVTDHTHYWEDEGFGYHTRYSSFRFSRGQEGDPVYGTVETEALWNKMNGRRVPSLRVQDAVNRRRWNCEDEFPQAVTFQYGIEFIQENCNADHWFLHIETFDPHEPFTAPQRFRDMYGLKEPAGQEHDWPDYIPLDGMSDEKKIQQYRLENMALVSFCSWNLERVLNIMDQYHMWEDTMLIVNTDHGFFLGEHGWLGKNTGPYYNDVANIPLFIHDPRTKEQRPVNSELIQTVDIPATLLDFFGQKIPKDMTGRPVVKGRRTETRSAAFFGIFGGHINVTDGRHLYMKAPEENSSHMPDCYTIAGAHFTRQRIQEEGEPYELSMGRAFLFSKGYPLLRIGNMGNDFQVRQKEAGTMLFDLLADPNQEHPYRDCVEERQWDACICRWMKEMDAPDELYAYYGLVPEQDFTKP